MSDSSFLRVLVEKIIESDGFDSSGAVGICEKIFHLKIVDCSGLKLKKISTVYMYNLKSLNVSDNHLKSLKNSFSDGSMLVDLNLSRNSITELGVYLKRLNCLQNLDISSNKLKDIDVENSLPRSLVSINFLDNPPSLNKKAKWVSQKARRYLPSLRMINLERVSNSKKKMKSKKKNVEKISYKKNFEISENLRKDVESILIRFQDQEEENFDECFSVTSEESSMKLLDSIIRYLKKCVGKDGNAPKSKRKVIHEKMFQRDFWETGDNTINCFMLDSFLYDESVKMDMFLKHEIAPFYCAKCQCLIYINDESELRHVFKVKCKKKCKKSVKLRDQYSCSLSIRELSETLEIMKRNKLLGKEGFRNKKVIDIGSRLGNVLYYYYFLTNSSKIFGIEIESFFIHLTRDVISKFRLLKSRISLIDGDIKDYLSVLEECDIIHFSNPFIDFPKSIHKEYLNMFKNTMKEKSGAIIVSSPSIPFIFEQAGIPEKESMNWLVFHEADTFNDLFVYTVK